MHPEIFYAVIAVDHFYRVALDSSGDDLVVLYTTFACLGVTIWLSETSYAIREWDLNSDWAFKTEQSVRHRL